MAFQPSTTGQSLPHEQSQMLLQTLPLMLVVELLAACAISWLFHDGPLPDYLLYGWLVAAAVLTLWRLRLLFQFRQQFGNPHADTQLPARRLMAMIVAGALLFALATPLFNLPGSLPDHTDLQHRLYAVILLGLTIIGTASYSANLRASHSYVIIVMLPLALLLGLLAIKDGQPLGTLLTPLLMIALLVAGRRMHSLIMRSLRAELRNRSLIQFLESARGDAEQLSEKLAKEVFDRREARQHLQEAKERLEVVVEERTQALKQANKELSSTSQRLQLALDASRISLWDWNLSTGAAFQSNFADLLGCQPIGDMRLVDQITSLIHPDDLAVTRAALTRHFKGQTSFYQSTYRMRHADGRWIWIEDHGQVVRRDEQHRATRMIGTRRNVTEAHNAEEQRRLAATVFVNASEGIFIFDTELHFLAVNDSFARISGYEESELIGQPLLNTINPDNRALYADIQNTLFSEGMWQGEVTERRKNGEMFPEWLQLNAVYDDQHRLTHFVGMVSDLTERRKGEERLQFLSNHDRLTGLANRNQFREVLQRYLSVARLKRTKVALLYMDLDRFKPINDTLGHEVGDAVLKLCAQRVLDCGLEEEQVARVDSDEFTMLLHYNDNAEIEALCHRIINSLKQPYAVGSHELLLGTSIGISLYPDSAKDVRSLISQADIAMHQSKRMGGNTFQYYRSDMRTATVEQLALETSLKKALSRNEFVVYYQPKLDLADGIIRGSEALIRWQHPTMGLLMPGTFIPLAEETGLITDIGEWVLNEACRQTARWQHMGIGTLTTSVNLSAQQFRSTDVVALVQKALKSAQLAPHQLEMELTETLLMDDLEANIDMLNRLRKLGVGLSLDDFGTGYSSLSYLKRFPIDELKIDRAFIMDMEHNEDDASIVRAIINMAHSLRLRVVAEGVESQPQLEKLRMMGCDAIQGYLISRPVPATEMEALLSLQRARHSTS